MARTILSYGRARIDEDLFEKLVPNNSRLGTAQLRAYLHHVKKLLTCSHQEIIKSQKGLQNAYTVWVRQVDSARFGRPGQQVLRRRDNNGTEC